MYPKKLTKTLNKELGLLWSAWSGLGLYTDAKPIATSPEACLVGLACIGHYDQRLYDEALSLLRSHPNMVRAPFVKYWMKMLDSKTQDRLSLILDFCKILKTKPKRPISPSENFFQKIDQTLYFNGRQQDSYFEKFGFKRNPFVMSNNVPELSVIADINPFIKMRFTSGFQAQSDAWVYLLYFKELTVPQIQSILGVTAKSSWNILQNIHQSGWVTKKSIGKIDRYILNQNGNKVFSFLKSSKMICTPVNWIKLSHRLSAIGDKEVTEKYYEFLDGKLTGDLNNLEAILEFSII